MYRLGRHSKKKAKKHLWLVILAVLLVPFAAGGYFIVKLMKDGETKPTTPLAITREYAVEEVDDRKVFDQDGFSIKLPPDWIMKGHNTRPHNIYAFKATKKNADQRTLEVFVDRFDAEKAFNRLLPVSVEGNKIIVTGSVSENCVTFTGAQPNTPDPKVSWLPAKWQGVDFRCDMANRVRNVVGVGTPGGKPGITLSGPRTGSHTFFFVYIDHNINPDYQILEDALASLEVK